MECPSFAGVWRLSNGAATPPPDARFHYTQPQPMENALDMNDALEINAQLVRMRADRDQIRTTNTRLMAHLVKALRANQGLAKQNRSLRVALRSLFLRLTAAGIATTGPPTGPPTHLGPNNTHTTPIAPPPPPHNPLAQARINARVKSHSRADRLLLKTPADPTPSRQRARSGSPEP